METNSARPSPEQARQALDGAARARHAVRYPPMPGWFYPVMSTLMALLFVVRGFTDSRIAFFGVVLAMIGIGMRSWINRPGVCWSDVGLRDVLPMVVAIAVLWFAALLLNSTWSWVAGAALAAAIVAVTGWRYEQFVRRDA